MTMTHVDLAMRWLGIHERPGGEDHPLIVWFLSLVGLSDVHDEVAWCSAALAGLASIFGVLPPKVTAAARSWLLVGDPIDLVEADADHFDVVVLKRGPAPQPGADVIMAIGHVGLFVGMASATTVRLWSGNMGNAITLNTFPVSDVLGVRRIA